MDDDQHIDLDLDEIDFAPMGTAERLALLTLEEAHDVLRLLVTVAQEPGPMSREADRLARRLPSVSRRRTDPVRSLRHQGWDKSMMCSWTSGWQWPQAFRPEARSRRASSRSMGRCRLPAM
ncbi:hypothetical protein H0H10_13690 [Streptomyces sp. TRM S81-3]|uniref:Uncharacterized protein n=1 Tax=Streptomyces griseicoloratus TaxID=2752516 RepID=A0A926L4T1_9ACTN|nr:DUF6417 family protein [Streptomyces griseicoloratus]MBD0420207.1 hypothetical protein [Streptomyces griseicoloratus]